MAANEKNCEKISQPDAEKKRLLPNALFAVAQVVVSSLVLFLVYRYLLIQLGVEALGVWTLVMAATSLANVSNLGIAGGLVRFVSKYLALGDTASATSAVETGIISLAIVVGIMGFIIWFGIDWGLGWVIPLNWLPQARAILPFSILALWLSTVGGVIHSALEGCHRTDLRSISTLLSQPILLIGTLFLTPSLGLKGVAIAQMGQYLAWIVTGWFLLKRELISLPVIPHRVSQKLFMEMWRYGLNFQLISILAILSEPLAKGLLSHFTSLSSLAYFEMANRLITQIRAILLSGSQVMAPYYSKLHSTESAQIRNLYLRNLKLISLSGSAIFACAIASSPLISKILIGHFEPEFIWFVGILSIGWFVNAIAIPAYFANLGIGHLGPNVRGHFVIMLTMLIAGIAFGSLIKPYGSAMAWPLGLILGSFFIDQGFLTRIKLSRTLWSENLHIPFVLTNFGIALAATLASSYFLQIAESNSTWFALGTSASAILLIALLNAQRVLKLIRPSAPHPTIFQAS